MEPLIPSDVTQFIVGHIDSIAELEAVLLLRQSPDTWWESEQVAARLYISKEQCAPVLDKLCRNGLLVSTSERQEPVYRYRPDTGDLREMVDRVAYYYAKHLVPVSNLVHDKVRMRMERFSQAFKLWPKE